MQILIISLILKFLLSGVQFCQNRRKFLCVSGFISEFIFSMGDRQLPLERLYESGIFENNRSSGVGVLHTNQEKRRFGGGAGI